MLASVGGFASLSRCPSHYDDAYDCVVSATCRLHLSLTLQSGLYDDAYDSSVSRSFQLLLETTLMKARLSLVVHWCSDYEWIEGEDNCEEQRHGSFDSSPIAPERRSES